MSVGQEGDLLPDLAGHSIGEVLDVADRLEDEAVLGILRAEGRDLADEGNSEQ